MKNIIKIFLIFAIITSMASAVYYPYKSTFPLSANISMNNHKLTDLAAPTASNDAATKAYVDSSGGSGGDEVVTVGPYAWCDYVTDGTDDYVQLQAANDYSYLTYGGGKILVIGNIYLGSGDVVLSQYISLEGVNDPMADYATGQTLAKAQMSRILITKTTGSGAITLNSMNAVKNIGFWYPNQVTSGTPTVYPPTLKIADCAQHVFIQRVNCGNAYYFIDASGQHNSLQCDYVYGSPISRFVLVSNSWGGDLFQNCDIWPLYTFTTPSDSYLSWIQENLICFEVYQSDGIRFRDCNIFGAGYGWRFHGTSRPTIIGCETDAVLNPIASDSNAYIIQIDNCLIDVYRWKGDPEWTTSGFAICINGGWQHCITNNKIIRSGSSAIWIADAFDCVVSNNLIPDFGKSGTFLNRALMFHGDSSVISGNQMDAQGATGTQGIYLEGNGNTVIGNVLKGMEYPALWIHTGSAHNVVVGNCGTSTGGLTDNSGQTNEVAHNYWT